MFVGLLCIIVAVFLTVLFWNVGGIGIVFGLFFVGTLALAIGGSVRQGFRK